MAEHSSFSILEDELYSLSSSSSSAFMMTQDPSAFHSSTSWSMLTSSLESTSVLTSSLESTSSPVMTSNMSIPLYRKQSALAVSFIKAAYKVVEIVLPVAFVLGLFGNIMILIIIRRLQARGSRSSIDVYLQTLAILDAGVVLTSFVPSWFEVTLNIKFSRTVDATCKLLGFSTMAGTDASAWVKVLMATQRAMSVVWPHRVGVICTPRRSKIFIIVTVILTSLINIHLLYGMGLDPFGNCTIQDAGYARFVEDVFVWINLFAASILPFLCLLLSNAVLIYQLRGTVSGEKDSIGASAGNDSQQKARKKAVNTATVTAVVVSVSFVVLTFPQCVYFLIGLVYTGMEDMYAVDSLALKVFLLSLFATIANFNYSVNFYLYCLTGAKFRRQFLTMFGCYRQESGDTTSYAQSRAATNTVYMTEVSYKQNQ